MFDYPKCTSIYLIKTYKIHKIVICSLNAIFPLTILPKSLHLIKSKVKQIVWKVMSSLIFILKDVITTVMWSIYNAHDSSTYNLYIQLKHLLVIKDMEVSIIYDISYDNYSTVT